MSSRSWSVKKVRPRKGGKNGPGEEFWRGQKNFHRGKKHVRNCTEDANGNPIGRGGLVLIHRPFFPNSSYIGFKVRGAVFGKSVFEHIFRGIFAKRGG